MMKDYGTTDVDAYDRHNILGWFEASPIEEDTGERSVLISHLTPGAAVGSPVYLELRFPAV